MGPRRDRQRLPEPGLRGRARGGAPRRLERHHRRPRRERGLHRALQRPHLADRRRGDAERRRRQLRGGAAQQPERPRLPQRRLALLHRPRLRAAEPRGARAGRERHLPAERGRRARPPRRADRPQRHRVLARRVDPVRGRQRHPAVDGVPGERGRHPRRGRAAARRQRLGGERLGRRPEDRRAGQPVGDRPRRRVGHRAGRHASRDDQAERGAGQRGVGRRGPAHALHDRADRAVPHSRQRPSAISRRPRCRAARNRRLGSPGIGTATRDSRVRVPPRRGRRSKGGRRCAIP